MVFDDVSARRVRSGWMDHGLYFRKHSQVINVLPIERTQHFG
jgi:hypothetical protein